MSIDTRNQPRHWNKSWREEFLDLLWAIAPRKYHKLWSLAGGDGGLIIEELILTDRRVALGILRTIAGKGRKWAQIQLAPMKPMPKVE